MKYSMYRMEKGSSAGTFYVNSGLSKTEYKDRRRLN